MHLVDALPHLEQEHGAYEAELDRAGKEEGTGVVQQFAQNAAVVVVLAGVLQLGYLVPRLLHEGLRA